MLNLFQEAKKVQSFLRMAIAGPAGSGKTYTALAIACAIALKMGKRVAVVDTEKGSASKYAQLFDFDTLPMGPGATLPDGSPSPFQDYNPANYVKCIDMAVEAGYGVVVLDSITHAWNARGGVKEIVDKAVSGMGGNRWAAWSKGTPAHNALVDAMTGASCHVIATMRTKTEYAEVIKSNGRKSYEKIGTAPVQRDGIDYEFDVFMQMTAGHDGEIQKTRCPDIADETIEKPGPKLAEVLMAWLDGEEPPPPVDWLEAAKEAVTLDEWATAVYNLRLCGDIASVDKAKSFYNNVTGSSPLRAIQGQPALDGLRAYCEAKKVGETGQAALEAAKIAFDVAMESFEIE